VSSTRTPKRTGADDYPTPAWAVRSVVPVLERLFPGGVRQALEPAAGDGAVIRAIEETSMVQSWYAIELRDECADHLLSLETHGRLQVETSDFVERHPYHDFDLVITNPPYTLAIDFVQRSLEWVHENGWVVMLLRLAFLEGQKRSQWMRGHAPDVYVLPKRPSFTGRGTDSCAYAWMAWQRRLRKSGRVEILEVPK